MCVQNRHSSSTGLNVSWRHLPSVCSELVAASGLTSQYLRFHYARPPCLNLFRQSIYRKTERSFLKLCIFKIMHYLVYCIIRKDINKWPSDTTIVTSYPYSYMFRHREDITKLILERFKNNIQSTFPGNQIYFYTNYKTNYLRQCVVLKIWCKQFGLIIRISRTIARHRNKKKEISFLT